ncbi:MAG: UDP-N-acetylmuramoyl-L-alanyl-D-glutamate--2,6-diaminopimelate ligase [Minisyncoccia bacterium]
MNKTLSSLLETIPFEECLGTTDRVITDVTIDSRTVTATALFVAQKGETLDGHDFIGQAIENGARTIVCQTIPSLLHDGVTYIKVIDSHHAAGLIASWLYDFPARDLTLIGVTGTNGKTTVATLLWQSLRLLGNKVGLISTVSHWIDECEIPSTHTTPDAITLQKLFRTMADAGCTHVIMEVSSHAIAQKRIAGLTFAVGIFTNLTQDHLDFHNTMEAYGATKKTFFSSLQSSAYAITNFDDSYGASMVDDTQATTLSYAITAPADYVAKDILLSIDGTSFTIENTALASTLIGAFNLSNILAVYACLRTLSYNPSDIAQIIPALVPPPGRLELIKGPEDRIGVIDYAHTPDGLEKLLTTLQAIKKPHTQLIVVFGCGGDRDTSKRPLMGTIALTHSDYCVITSDNPRNESPQSICDDILKGLPEQRASYIVIVDRKEAIYHAVQNSLPGDTIVIAGKGHEEYQIIGTDKLPFSDRTVLAEAFTALE